MYFILVITISDGCAAMIPNLDIDLLKTFLAISDAGSFTRAAEEVNKTQSAVSMQMKRLEELLGRPLFVRDGRASRFTPDGERLVEYARRLVSLNDEAVSTFKRPELTGTVRFGTPDDYADRFLPEILARFARTHPLVTVNVDCHETAALFERTRRGELDLSLVTFGCDISPTSRSGVSRWCGSPPPATARTCWTCCRLPCRTQAASGAAPCCAPSTGQAASTASPIRARIRMR
jgi:DNA-binding transcriptional LysR family regulator